MRSVANSCKTGVAGGFLRLKIASFPITLNSASNIKQKITQIKSILNHEDAMVFQSISARSRHSLNDYLKILLFFYRCGRS
jgi:hypothetical protein